MLAYVCLFTLFAPVPAERPPAPPARGPAPSMALAWISADKSLRIKDTLLVPTIEYRERLRKVDGKLVPEVYATTVYRTRTVERIAPPGTRVTGLDGKAIEGAELARRLGGLTPVVVPWGGGELEEEYRRLFQPGTLVLVYPRAPVGPIPVPKR